MLLEFWRQLTRQLILIAPNKLKQLVLGNCRGNFQRKHSVSLKNNVECTGFVAAMKNVKITIHHQMLKHTHFLINLKFSFGITFGLLLYLNQGRGDLS